MSTRLQNALEALYGLERRRDKLGLDGTRALLAALGNPHERFRSVHVAGTNGKGSVCAIVERVLREAGVRTGLYTSPHLVDFRERIRVIGQWADEARLGQRLAHIQSLPEGRDRTFFEVCTALAFDDFAARGVEWAVVEVGLGGRLDCTNVITPAVCVITSIGLDHTEILGDTIGKIAAEKAGIIKPGVPVVVAGGPGNATIAAIARERGAPLTIARAGTRPPSWRDVALPPGLDGTHQAANAGLALQALARLRDAGLAIPDDALKRGLGGVRWPGRLERSPREPRLVWDGAHNPQGIAALASAWEAVGGADPATVVLAVSRDKDVRVMLETLARRFPRARLIATRSRSERALEPESLARIARETGIEAESAPDVNAALARALARPGRESVLLTGSLFAIGEAMETYGGAPGEWL